MIAKIEASPILNLAAEMVFSALHNYLEVMQRVAPGELSGLVVIQQGNELLVYSENRQWTKKLKATIGK